MTHPPNLKLNDTISYQDHSGVVHFGCIVGPYTWDSERNDWFVPIRIRLADTVSAPLRVVRARALASQVEAWPRSRAMRDDTRPRAESDFAVSLAHAS